MMSKGMAEYYKKAYPPETRVQLDSMGGTVSPLPSYYIKISIACHHCSQQFGLC